MGDRRIITTEQWQNEFFPIQNPVTGEEYFETYGSDYDAVRKADSNKIWTEVEDDFGDLVILPGFHFVNRMRYYITTLPFNKNIEVSDIEYINRDKAIDICLELNKKLKLNYPEDLVFKYYIGDEEISVSKAEHICITMFEEHGSISESDMLKINDYYSMLK